MQAGKTGAIIKCIDQFKNNHKNKKMQIIYLINIADTVLDGQTEQRVADAGFGQTVKVYHHGQFSKCQLQKVDCRLIIIDQSHLALGGGIDKDKLKPFEQLLAKFGISYNEDPKNWCNDNGINYVVSVSATPYALLIKDKLNPIIQKVQLQTNSQYNSVKTMNNRGILHKSQPLTQVVKTTKQRKVSIFTKNVLQQFIQKCKQSGNGFLLVRTRWHETMKKHIQATYGDSIDSKEYNSKNKNIKDISKLLKTDIRDINKPTVVFISGSLRAGKTMKINQFKNVKMILDSDNSKNDTVAQGLLGRCCGYGKKDIRIKIYCDLEQVDNYIKYLDDQKIIPSGAHNSSTKKDITSVLGTKIFKDKEQYSEFVKKLNIDRGLNLGYVITTISGNKNDICKDLLQKGYTGRGTQKQIDGGAYQFIHIDGKSKNIQLQESWNRLVKERPEWVGKYLYIEKQNSEISIYENKINSTCLLSK